MLFIFRNCVNFSRYFFALLPALFCFYCLFCFLLLFVACAICTSVLYAVFPLIRATPSFYLITSPHGVFFRRAIVFVNYVPYLSYYDIYGKIMGYDKVRFVTLFDPEFDRFGSSNLDKFFFWKYHRP